MGMEEFGGQEEAPDGEDLLQRQQRIHRQLIDSVRMSDAMRAFIVTPAGEALKIAAERRLLESLTHLLAHGDLRHPNAITAHFNARVATSLMQVIDEIIQAGIEARQSIEASDAEVNSGGENEH